MELPEKEATYHIIPCFSDNIRVNSRDSTEFNYLVFLSTGIKNFTLDNPITLDQFSHLLQ